MKVRLELKNKCYLTVFKVRRLEELHVTEGKGALVEGRGLNKRGRGPIERYMRGCLWSGVEGKGRNVHREDFRWKGLKGWKYEVLGGKGCSKGCV